MLALHGNAADGAGSIPIDWNTNAEGDLDEIGGCFRGGLSIEWCRCNVCDPLMLGSHLIFEFPLSKVRGAGRPWSTAGIQQGIQSGPEPPRSRILGILTAFLRITYGRRVPRRPSAQALKTKNEASDRARAFFGQLIHASQSGEAIRCRVASLGSRDRVSCCTCRPVTSCAACGRHRSASPRAQKSRVSIARG